MARDPRVEPRVGDIIEQHGTFVRVYHDDKHPELRIISVMVLTRDAPVPHIGVSIDQWRNDTATATIIHAEGE